MAIVSEEFHRRVARIPAHGVGLSVDVYSPDIFSLLDELEIRGLTYGYLEVFKASSRALGALRRRVPGARLAYHGEGIWLTQPDLLTTYPIERELRSAASHLHLLDSAWINHECASKQIAGYSFGTYLPPLFTHDAALITSRNVRRVQGELDSLVGDRDGVGPLLLLELPPLTYFKFGDVGLPEFFQTVASHACCGLVLDVGHLWTVYRYSGEQSSSLRSFVLAFLDRFPLERVVQIHLAGLGPAATSAPPVGRASPRGDCWIDAHACAIPEVLFDMLDLILPHPRLRHLRGVALEIDQKPVDAIVAEFEAFGKRYGERIRDLTHQSPEPRGSGAGTSPARAEQDEPGRSSRVLALYDAYARVVSGRVQPGETSLPVGDQDAGGLERYRRAYLPEEILNWGGSLRDLFPETCRRLDAEGVPLVTFVGFWFRTPRPVTEPYDFFLIKLDQFVEFVRECLPQAAEQARREAETMREAYGAANDLVSVGEE